MPRIFSPSLLVLIAVFAALQGFAQDSDEWQAKDNAPFSHANLFGGKKIQSWNADNDASQNRIFATDKFTGEEIIAIAAMAKRDPAATKLVMALQKRAELSTQILIGQQTFGNQLASDIGNIKGAKLLPTQREVQVMAATGKLVKSFDELKLAQRELNELEGKIRSLRSDLSVKLRNKGITIPGEYLVENHLTEDGARFVYRKLGIGVRSFGALFALFGIVELAADNMRVMDGRTVGMVPGTGSVSVVKKLEGVKNEK